MLELAAKQPVDKTVALSDLEQVSGLSFVDTCRSLAHLQQHDYLEERSGGFLITARGLEALRVARLAAVRLRPFRRSRPNRLLGD